MSENTYSEIKLFPDDRILILAPHPDDADIACGGIIQKAVKLKIPVKIVYFTYGDSNEWSFILYRKRPVILPKTVRLMGLKRHDEAVSSGQILGIPSENLIFLGYPDFGTLKIWDAHWNSELPLKSLLTRVSEVPYKNAFRPGAAYKGEEILNDLKTVLQEFKPTKIFLSHLADHNPDHQALYLFTTVALWDIRSQIHPEIYSYPVHFKFWPAPRGYHPAKELLPPGEVDSQISWSADYLNENEISNKYSALKAHRTQLKADSRYLPAFVNNLELFGDFDCIELSSRVYPVLLAGNRKEIVERRLGVLEEADKNDFVGIKQSTVCFQDDTIILTISLSGFLRKRTRASGYAFGYRSDTKFENMPKIHILIGERGHKVFNQQTLLSDNSIEVKRTSQEIEVSVPMGLLGYPEKILTGARTSKGEMLLDWVCWRILKIPSN